MIYILQRFRSLLVSLHFVHTAVGMFFREALLRWEKDRQEQCYKTCSSMQLARIVIGLLIMFFMPPPYSRWFLARITFKCKPRDNKPLFDAFLGEYLNACSLLSSNHWLFGHHVCCQSETDWCVACSCANCCNWCSTIW